MGPFKSPEREIRRPHGRRGRRALEQLGGALPNILEAASAFALSDFVLNPMRTVLFVPKQLNEKYSTAFGRIAEELTAAIGPTEPGRTKRIGASLRGTPGSPSSS